MEKMTGKHKNLLERKCNKVEQKGSEKKITIYSKSGKSVHKNFDGPLKT